MVHAIHWLGFSFWVYVTCLKLSSHCLCLLIWFSLCCYCEAPSATILLLSTCLFFTHAYHCLLTLHLSLSSFIQTWFTSHSVSCPTGDWRQWLCLNDTTGNGWGVGGVHCCCWHHWWNCHSWTAPRLSCHKQHVHAPVHQQAQSIN